MRRRAQRRAEKHKRLARLPTAMTTVRQRPLPARVPTTVDMDGWWALNTGWRITNIQKKLNTEYRIKIYTRLIIKHTQNKLNTRNNKNTNELKNRMNYNK